MFRLDAGPDLKNVLKDMQFLKITSAEAFLIGTQTAHEICGRDDNFCKILQKLPPTYNSLQAA